MMTKSIPRQIPANHSDTILTAGGSMVDDDDDEEYIIVSLRTRFVTVNLDLSAFAPNNKAAAATPRQEVALAPTPPETKNGKPTLCTSSGPGSTSQLCVLPPLTGS